MDPKLLSESFQYALRYWHILSYRRKCLFVLAEEVMFLDWCEVKILIYQPCWIRIDKQNVFSYKQERCRQKFVFRMQLDLCFYVRYHKWLILTWKVIICKQNIVILRFSLFFHLWLNICIPSLSPSFQFYCSIWWSIMSCVFK